MHRFGRLLAAGERADGSPGGPAVRASLSGALGALALLVGVGAAWQAFGARGLIVAAVGTGLLALLALGREQILGTMPSLTLLRTTRKPSLLVVSLGIGAWLAATIFTLTSLSPDSLPPSGGRVTELGTNVDGLVAAVQLLGGGDGTSHEDGPSLTPAFPVAGADPAMSETATPTTEATMSATEASVATSTPATSFDFAAPQANSSATPPVGATPSPLSQPRISSGPGGGPLDTAGQNLYNCTDFDSWEQAVAVFRASGVGDPNLLDTDGNGIPCEELKAAELSRR